MHHHWLYSITLQFHHRLYIQSMISPTGITRNYGKVIYRGTNGMVDSYTRTCGAWPGTSLMATLWPAGMFCIGMVNWSLCCCWPACCPPAPDLPPLLPPPVLLSSPPALAIETFLAPGAEGNRPKKETLMGVIKNNTCCSLIGLNLSRDAKLICCYDNKASLTYCVREDGIFTSKWLYLFYQEILSIKT